MKQLGRTIQGFSLVEISIALGIVAFALTTLLALLPLALSSNHVAIEQTVAHGIVSSVIADLRAAPPVPEGAGSALSEFYDIPIPAAPSSTLTTIYISADGQASKTVSTASRYRLGVSFLSRDASVLRPGAKQATLALIRISWPAQAAPSPRVEHLDSFVALDRN